MKHAHALLPLSLVLLAACGKPPGPPAPPAPPPPPTVSSDADQSFIGRKAAEAIDQARKELATKNISIGDGVNIDVNGRHFRTGNADGLPKAEITPAGDLLIEGKAVAVNDAQRKDLLAYRGEIVAIADAGMTMGAQGANIAGHALSGVAGAIFGGKEGQQDFEKKIKAEADKIEAEALKLCGRLPAMLASQQALAASLPAFKPYARMTQDDIDDCGKKDHDGGGVAVTAGSDDNG